MGSSRPPRTRVLLDRATGLSGRQERSAPGDRTEWLSTLLPADAGDAIPADPSTAIGGDGSPFLRAQVPPYDAQHGNRGEGAQSARWSRPAGPDSRAARS